MVGAEGVPLADANFLYDLTYTTTTQVQGEIQRAVPHLLEMFQVREK